jgi:PKD repeat protein
MMVKGAGTVFGTVGTGGTALRSIHVTDPEFPYFAATSGSDREPAHGFLQVSVSADSLEGRFVPVGTTTFADSFSITGGNLPPTAAFTASTTDMTVALDASGSSDADGAIASYRWDFGDGQTAAGAVTSHTYVSPGDYQVVLTVTDDDGATATASRTVTASDPTGDPPPFATDEFERTLTNQWGPADLGGTWGLTGGASANFAVGDGTGFIRMPAPGAAPGAYLAGISSTETEVGVQVGQDKPPTGTGTSVRVQPRRLANGDGYFAAVRFVPNGSVAAKLVRLVGTQSLLATVTVPGLTHQPGDTFHVRAQVTGMSPTTIRAKVWKVGTPEPSSWTVNATDSTAGLQAPGGIGLRAELGSNATNAPVRASFDKLWAGPVRP